MRALLVQPPFAQLNAPYPAVHYLEAFLRARGIESRAVDHSIELYRALYSRSGLAPVFAAARRALDRAPDEATRSQLERYLSYERAYSEWAEPLADFLSGGDPGFAHRLAGAAELPLGMRSEALLESRGGRVDPAEAGLLATKMLEDLGDLVAFAYDPHFETVRYGERLAASRSDFASIAAAAERSPLMGELYAPVLGRCWAAQGAAPELLLVSIPFPGSLVGALACARSAREAFGAATTVVFGGGYVSTELRGLRDPAIFDYCDYLAFDAGYGALASILEAAGGSSRDRLYRCMYRDGQGRVVCAGFPRGDSAREPAPRAVGAAAARGAAAGHEARPDGPEAQPDGPEAQPGGPEAQPAGPEAQPGGPAGAAAARAAADPWPPRLATDCADESRFRAEETAAVRTTFPDYRWADFGRYLASADSSNPMHRLWSGPPWLKYHLARGCYWRRCAFCDTELEYVADYAPSEIDALCDAMDAASARTGLYGIHFVDEAMPMGRLLAFARRNRARAGAEGKRPYHFWGNARFDASWTADRSAFLAASGLVAVSGGIEIATERGLEMTDKGFDLSGLVRALAAMKANGILVHAYLIYGFPGQREADIVDSAEICRQLFAAGLVDSAFWHRFVLTRHSRMLAERLDGARPALAPVDRPWSFANNDMSFKGEGAYDRYEEPLSAALAAWMEGEGLDRPADAWFAPSRGRPALPDPGLVAGLLEAAEERAAAEAEGPADPEARAFWIAGTPSAAPGPRRGAALLRWAYRGSMVELGLPAAEAERLASRIAALAAAPEGLPLREALGDPLPGARAVAALRGAGLVLP